MKYLGNNSKSKHEAYLCSAYALPLAWNNFCYFWWTRVLTGSDHSRPGVAFSSRVASAEIAGNLDFSGFQTFLSGRRNCTEILFSFILTCVSLVILGITSAHRNGNSSFLWRLRFAYPNNKHAFKAVPMQLENITRSKDKNISRPDLALPRWIWT